jgi:bifunctional DNA-binding transcriptional regulator/antitoxin component of YhaV-PrlF toxin-antitoxin module
MADAERLTRIVRSSRSGRLTIPAEFRRRLGIGQETVLQLTLDTGELRVRPVRANEAGSPWFARLYELLGPVRHEAIERGYSEEEVNAWIDEAVRAVRRGRG